MFTDAFDGIVEIAGPERLRLDEVATEIATAFEDNRRVVADIRAPYFGLELGERSLLPGPDARIAAPVRRLAARKPAAELVVIDDAASAK